MTPRTQALAYRIWAHCEPIGWNCTHSECAEALGESSRRVAKIAGLRGWQDRFRVVSREGTLKSRLSPADYGLEYLTA